MERIEDGAQRMVRAGDIEVVEGHNPRTHFDEAAMAELEGSIRDKGVLQSLLVRQTDDGRIQLIAGERRLRATLATRGSDEMVPVIVKDCADSEMAAMAVVENTHRDDMGYANEAEGAFRLMQLLRGNKEEVAAQLNWSADKLERRLALMQATVEVRAALSQRKIELGHAELLAAVPKEKQNKALGVVIEQKLPVSVLRKEIGKLANALTDAVFDKAECVDCSYNSARQNSLFKEAIAEGYCTNAACYGSKTDQHLEGVAKVLREDVPRVEIVKGGGAVNAIKLVVEGKGGVGAAQASSCRGCSNFGCTVSAVPGSVGAVERSMCFDSDCNASKVVAQLRVQKEAAEAAKKAQEAVKAAGGTEAQAKAAGQKAQTDTEEQAAREEAAAGGVSTRVKEYRTKVWRQTAARVAFNDSGRSRDLLLALGVAGRSRCIDQTKLKEVLGKLGGSKVDGDVKAWSGIADVGAAISGLDAKVKGSMLDALAASAMANLELRDLAGSLSFLGVRLENHWTIDAEFLGLLTKSEIYAICKEIGLVDQMGEKEFRAAMSGKKEDFIKAILKTKGFDFRGAVPKVMRWDEEVVVEVNESESQVE